MRSSPMSGALGPTGLLLPLPARSGPRVCAGCSEDPSAAVRAWHAASHDRCAKAARLKGADEPGAVDGRRRGRVTRLHDSWAVMCASSPGGAFEERDGVVRASTGMPVAPFNGVWSTAADVAVSDVLDAVDEFAGG